MKRIIALLLLSLVWLPATLLAGVPVNFASLDELPAEGTLIIPVVLDGALPSLLAPAVLEEVERAMVAAQFSGSAGSLLPLYGVGPYELVLLAGLGDEQPDRVALADLGGRVAAQVGAGKNVGILWQGIATAEAWPAAHIALGLSLGGYRFDKYKTVADPEESAVGADSFTIFSADAAGNAARWRDNWLPVARSIHFARDLINEPGNVIYPASFVERVREAFKGVRGVNIEVLEAREMQRLGMGSLLGVGMGSERGPRLLVVHYRGGERGQAPLAFVGKGVTFDSGGLSLKSPKGMWRMKYDMAGAAAATGTVLALAGRRAPVNAVAVAALVENMPSATAQRPGDVRTAMSGKTIEVINTDAEGRLILADAVWYAQKEIRPRILVDIATLTGAVKTALGLTYGGLFSRHDELSDQLLAAGAGADEALWRLPLHADFVKALKSDIADVKNKVEGGYGGASVGAEFIGSFVEQDMVWAHLDIAGRGWEFTGRPTVPKGAAGFGIRLLNQWVLDTQQ